MFNIYFKRIKDSQSISYVLATLNYTFQINAVNIGEEIRVLAKKISPILCDHLASSHDLNIKRQIIEFFRLLIRLDRKVTKFDKFKFLNFGVFSEPSMVQQLYENIFTLLQKERLTNSKRTTPKYSQLAAKEDSFLSLDISSFSLTDLASDLLFLVHNQPSLLNKDSSIGSEEQQPIKKQKLSHFSQDDIWNHLFEKIYDCKGNIVPNSSISFLKVLVFILNKYSYFIPINYLNQSLQIFIQLLDNKNKDLDMDSWIFQGIINISKEFIKFENQKEFKLETESKWIQIWNLTLKKISSGTLSIINNKAMEVLCYIIKNEFITKQIIISKPDITWNLFVFSDKNLSFDSLIFIIEFTKNYEIPEDIQYSSGQSIREKLLDLLISSLSLDARELQKSTQKINYNSISQMKALYISYCIFSLISSKLPDYHLLNQFYNKNQEIEANHSLIINNIQILSDQFETTKLIEENLKQIEKSRIIIPSNDNKKENEFFSNFSNIFSYHNDENNNLISSTPRSQFLSPKMILHLHEMVIQKLSTIHNEFISQFNEINQKTRKTLGIDSSRLVIYLNHICYFSQVLLFLCETINKISSSPSSNQHSEELIKLIKNQFHLIYECLEKLNNFPQKMIHVLHSLQNLFHCFIKLSKLPSLSTNDEKSKVLEPIKILFLKHLKYFEEKLQISHNSNESISSSMEVDGFLSDDDDLMIIDEKSSSSSKNSKEIIQNKDTIIQIIHLCKEIIPCFTIKEANIFVKMLQFHDENEIIFPVCKILLSISSITFCKNVLKIVMTMINSIKILDPTKLKNILMIYCTILNHEKEIDVFPSDMLKYLDYLTNFFKEIWDGNHFNWNTRIEFARFISQLLNSSLADRYDFLQNIFLELLKDNDFRVRFYMSNVIHILFEIYNEPISILEDILEQINPLLNDGSVESQMTSLLTLSKITSSYPVRQSEIILEFCKFKSDDDEFDDFIISSLQYISLQSNFPSLQSFMESHFSSIFSSIYSLDDDHNEFWSLFPIGLFECDSKLTFIKKYSHQIIPCLILSKNSSFISEIATLLETTEKQLIINEFPYIYAFSFPLYFSENESFAKSLWEDFLSKFISADEINQLILTHIDEIIENLLDRISSPSNTLTIHVNNESNDDSLFSNQIQNPFYSSDIIELTLDDLASNFELQSIGELLVKNPCFVHQLLLHFRKNLQSMIQRTENINSVILAFQFLIKHLDKRICRTDIFRDIIYFILFTLRFPSLIDSGCQLLLSICEILLHNNSITELQYHFSTIIATLIPLIKQTQVPMGVIKFLIIDNQDKLKDQIADLDSFPSGEIWNDVSNTWKSIALKSKQQQQQQNYSPLKFEMERFIRNSSISLSSVTKLASLNSLLQTLKNQKDHLSAFIKLEDGRNLINLLIRELISTCSIHEENDEIQLKASDCLGEVGILNPYAIAFPSKQTLLAISNQTSTSTIPKINRTIKSDAIQLSKTLTQEVILQILLKLKDYLVDNDIIIIEISSRILKNILVTKFGMQLLKFLNSTSSCVRYYKYLIPFYDKHKAIENHSTIVIDDSNENQLNLSDILKDLNLWNTNDKSYNQWLFNITAGFMKCSSVDSLRICSEICLYKIEFAELVFPYVLFLSLENYDIHSSFSSILNTIIFDESNENLESIQFMLQTLNFIKSEIIFREKLEKPVPKPSRSTKRSSSSSNDCKNSKSKQFWSSKLWPSEINLLKVAEAAQKCSAFLTSIHFLEFWCESEFGELQLPDWSEESIETSKARDLFFNAYTNINEPDSIIGINNPFNMLVQTKNYEHEENWNRAIDLYDSSLQKWNHSFLSDNNNTSTSNSSNNNNISVLFSGLLSSLQKSGHEHILHYYLHGFNQINPNDSEIISETQFEYFWRTSTWHPDISQLQNNLSDDSSSSSVPNLPFHQGVFYCLRSFIDFDKVNFIKCMKLTRLSLIHELQFMSVESTKNIYPVLSKLLFLNEIDSAWSFQLKQRNSKLSSSDTIKLIADENIRWFHHLDFLKDNNFDFTEPLLSLRTILLKITQKHDIVSEHLQSTIRLARKAKRFQIASNAIQSIKLLDDQLATEQKNLNLTYSPNFIWEREYCYNLWKQGESNKALMAIKQLLKKIESKNDNPNFIDSLIAEINYKIGKWMSQSGTESFEIISKYMEKCISFYGDGDGFDFGNLCAKANFTFAQFTDRLYQDLVNKLNYSEWDAALQEEKKKELAECNKLLQKMRSNNKEKLALQIHTTRLDRQLKLDNTEREQNENGKLI